MSSERSGFKACGYIWGAHNVFTPAGYCGCIKDKDIADPSGIVAVKGDAYIVASGAVGDWTGHDNDIAINNGGGWDFVTPKEGAFVYVRDEDVFYLFDGSAWISEIPFDDLKISGDILPKDDNVSDLGSSTKRFAEVHTVKAYIKDGTLYIKGDAGTWRPIEFHAGDNRVFVLALDTNEDLQIRRYVSDAYQDTPLFIDSSTGKVGILNTSPKEAFQIGSSSPVTFHDGGHKVLSWNAYFDGSWKFITANKYAAQIYFSPDSGYLRLRVSTGTGNAGDAITWTDPVVLTKDSHLGVFKTSPTEALDVDGHIKVQGSGSSLFVNGVTIVKKVVNYNDSFPVTLYAPADGDIILNIFARVTTAFDGSGNLEVGDDSDNDGYATLANPAANPDVTLNSTGYKLTGHYVKGVYLWNSGNTSPVVRGCTGASSEEVKVYSSMSGNTQGQIEFYLQVARVV